MKKKALLAAGLAGIMVITAAGSSMTVMAAEKPVITVWCESANTSMSDYMEAFESDEFDVDIVYYSSEDLKNQVRIALASGEGPDIMAANTGEFFDSIMQAGQALELDSYAEKYNWKENVESDYLDSMSMNGTLYGLPLQTQSAWGLMFYNKDFFEANDLEVSMYPTVEELTVLSEKLKDAGKQPIALGNVDMWPGILLFGDFLLQENSGDIIDKLNSGEESWADSETVKKCLENIAALGQNGCFSAGFEAQDHSAAIESFVNGTSAMMYMGTWWLTYVEGGLENMDFEFATIASPRIDGVEVSKAAQIWSSQATFINAAAENPDYCAEYLNYMAAPEAAQAQYKGALQPTFNPEYNENTLVIDPQLADSEAFNKVYDLEKVNYMDWNFPTSVTEALEIEIGKLMMGDTTVEEAMKEVNAVAEEERE
ncbi:MAG: ABC transporter substrate-binding protein [Eubacteriales bacterium]|nr:ABC transporter substrate-binding protein [Eubacteriales bacterium]